LENEIKRQATFLIDRLMENSIHNSILQMMTSEWNHVSGIHTYTYATWKYTLHRATHKP